MDMLYGLYVNWVKPGHRVYRLQTLLWFSHRFKSPFRKIRKYRGLSLRAAEVMLKVRRKDVQGLR